MVTKLNRSVISERQDAGCPHPDLRHLLAAVPRLLHLRQSQPRRDEHEAHPAHLSRVLLVRHDPLNGQPNRLLPHEPDVSIFLFFDSDQSILKMAHSWLLFRLFSVFFKQI